MRTAFEASDPNGSANDWESIQQEVRFMLDQVDELIEAIEAGKLQGIEATTQLDFLTHRARTDLGCAVLLRSNLEFGDEFGDEEAVSDVGMPDPLITEHKEFWKYVMTQFEKARDVFDTISLPQAIEHKIIYRNQRDQIDDFAQFYRRAYNSNSFIDAAKEERDNDMNRGHG